jgi:hypothetical protein
MAAHQAYISGGAPTLEVPGDQRIHPARRQAGKIRMEYCANLGATRCPDMSET